MNIILPSKRTNRKWFVIAFSVVFSSAMIAQQFESVKCGTANRFVSHSSPGVNGKIITTTVRPELQTSVLSPSKKFRIHFDTTGPNTPALVTPSGERITNTEFAFVDSVGKIFEFVWEKEISTFGFPAPASDGGKGGGDEYDIYIYTLDRHAYGFTEWDTDAPLSSSSGATRYSTYISIYKDYGSFPTIGMDGLKATAAHEFHHAIQVSRSGLWNDGEWYFYELSAEAMEPMVFPAVKDYIRDVRTYFNDIQKYSLYTPYVQNNFSHCGYERAIWGVFLMQRYGVGIMREMWEAVSSMKPIYAMKTVLENHETSLKKEFIEFCYWNYFTGWRADSTRYYPDARLFPTVNILETQTLSSTPSIIQHPGIGFSANYLQATHIADTAAFIIANVNMDEALGSGSGESGFQVRAALTPFDGSVQLSNGWSVKFSVTDPLNWKFTPIASDEPAVNTANICYPNPYRPAASSFYIGFNPLAYGRTLPQLSIYSSSYQCVFSGSVPVETFNGSSFAVWNGHTERGELASSGVYIYRLSTGESVEMGKFAVVR